MQLTGLQTRPSFFNRTPFNTNRPKKCPLKQRGIIQIRGTIEQEKIIDVQIVNGQNGSPNLPEKINNVVDQQRGCETLCSLEAPLPVEEGYNSKKDVFKAIAVGASISVIFSLLNTTWVANHLDLSMILVFILGYVGIIIEEELAFNKSGVALLMAVSLWTIRALAGEPGEVHHELEYAVSEVSEIIFFLLGAMTIVEVVDAHQGLEAPVVHTVK
eukprot:TRINITY_DN5841_c0_g1_i2.p1 TRINITY_DN5841_c0_g1~~TRINITY_DN5841_c0_g1_i2.p1  ORF type:complete len:215 (+),score=34.49 TRINITY_DN5841_c0_g1_i2:124-768(+)